jgi:hypothetical protein
VGVFSIGEFPIHLTNKLCLNGPTDERPRSTNGGALVGFSPTRGNERRKFASKWEHVESADICRGRLSRGEPVSPRENAASKISGGRGPRNGRRGKAIELARAIDLGAIIAHRTFEMEGAELVRRIREADPKVPLIMVSGIDRSAAARAAGATAFLHYDNWLLIGSVVEEHLRKSDAASASGECAVA